MTTKLITKQNPASLISLLNTLNMEQLHHMRRNVKLPNASQLNKGQLVERLYTHIIENVAVYLGQMDKTRYNLLKKFMKAPNAELSEMELVGDFELQYFEQYGMLFDNHQSIIMPQEVKEKLQNIDERHFNAIFKRNEEWIKLTIGLLYYYGIMNVPQLVNRIEQFTGQSVDSLTYMNVILDLESYDYSVKYTPYGFAYFTVEDAETIYYEARSRSNIDYYPLTKAQALRASDDEYVERSDAYRQFVQLLCQQWRLDREEADLLTADLVDHIQQGLSLGELMSNLQSNFEFADMNQLDKLTNALVSLMNNTRLWFLKGHTPNELFAQEQKHLKPLPKHPFVHSNQVGSSDHKEKSSNVYDFQTKKKVGRNDPCPCGSGKKFKKCCGS